MLVHNEIIIQMYIFPLKSGKNAPLPPNRNNMRDEMGIAKVDTNCEDTSVKQILEYVAIEYAK